jgi:hypothetical protein
MTSARRSAPGGASERLPGHRSRRCAGSLSGLAKELDKTHPGAAGSLREGMAETLTVLRLGVPPTLARTLRSTNAIESMISICRDHAKNVKRWRDGQMALRWCAAGMVEASQQFRRVNGHLHLAALRTALERHVAAETVGPDCNTQDVRSLMLTGPPPKFHGTRDILTPVVVHASACTSIDQGVAFTPGTRPG